MENKSLQLRLNVIRAFSVKPEFSWLENSNGFMRSSSIAKSEEYLGCLAIVRFYDSKV